MAASSWDSGVSGPELVEGWYGQPFDPPLGRTRDYVEIVRRVLLRREPVEYRGRYLSLPLSGGSGLGRPFRSMVRPLRPDLPIVLAAEGPRNVALAREIADGWMATYYSPYHDAHYRRPWPRVRRARGRTPPPRASRSWAPSR